MPVVQLFFQAVGLEIPLIFFAHLLTKFAQEPRVYPLWHKFGNNQGDYRSMPGPFPIQIHVFQPILRDGIFCASKAVVDPGILSARMVGDTRAGPQRRTGHQVRGLPIELSPFFPINMKPKVANLIPRPPVKKDLSILIFPCYEGNQGDRCRESSIPEEKEGLVLDFPGVVFQHGRNPQLDPFHKT